MMIGGVASYDHDSPVTTHEEVKVSDREDGEDLSRRDRADATRSPIVAIEMIPAFQRSDSQDTSRSWSSPNRMNARAAPDKICQR